MRRPTNIRRTKRKISRGFASGGIVGENMYKGMDDYLMSEMHVTVSKMAEVMGEAEQMEMNFGVPAI